MKSDIQIRNSADVCYIDIEGTIGVPEQWQFASPDDRVATYEKFRDAGAGIAAAGAKRLAGPKFSFLLNRISAVLFWLLAVSVIWNAFFKG